MYEVRYSISKLNVTIESANHDCLIANQGTEYLTKLKNLETNGVIVSRTILFENSSVTYLSIWKTKLDNDIFTEEVYSSTSLNSFNERLKNMGYTIQINKKEI